MKRKKVEGYIVKSIKKTLATSLELLANNLQNGQRYFFIIRYKRGRLYRLTIREK